LRLRGRIIDWNDEKGFGFVEYDKNKRAFVHIKAFTNKKIRPVNGNTIFYELDSDTTGRIRAINIDIKQRKNTILLEKDTKDSSRDNFVLIIPIVFTMYLIFLRHSIPLIIPYYFILGFITFYFYKIDKEAAERRRWRSSEKSLLILGLIGGWVGAIIAQRILRHKTIKKEFQFNFWVTVIANLAGLFAYLYSNI
jgi:uncharacterized membrane protein YsdA (DUF1294 family)/cold shock CspA family protein